MRACMHEQRRESLQHNLDDDCRQSLVLACHECNCLFRRRYRLALNLQPNASPPHQLIPKSPTAIDHPATNPKPYTITHL